MNINISLNDDFKKDHKFNTSVINTTISCLITIPIRLRYWLAL